MRAPSFSMSVRLSCLAVFPIALFAACGGGDSSGAGGAGEGGAGPTSASRATHSSSSTSMGSDSTGPTTTSTTSSVGPGGGGAGPTSSSTGAGGAVVVDPGTLDCDAATGAVPKLKLTPFLQNLTAPVSMVPAPGDASRFFVLSQLGQIQVVVDGAVQSTRFLDLSSSVDFDGDERGLLGIAMHPKYTENGRFFVYFSAKMAGANDSHAMTVQEFRRSASDPNKADPTPVATLISYADVEANQNGGQMAFSPADGKLYIGFGDGGGFNDEHSPGNVYCSWTCGNGQCKQTLLGKILRLDVDTSTGGAAYTPAGVVDGALPEIWDYGFRNPWRFSFDGCNGDLYIGDVGENTHEEIDFEPAGQGGKNYGWNCREGGTVAPDANLTGCDCDPSKFTDPALTWPNHNSVTAIIGGFVYRGATLAGLRGKYLFASYNSGGSRIWAVDKAINDGAGHWTWDDTANNPFDQIPSISIVSFAQDLNGEVYVVAPDVGIVYRVEAAN